MTDAARRVLAGGRHLQLLLYCGTSRRRHLWLMHLGGFLPLGATCTGSFTAVSFLGATYDWCISARSCRWAPPVTAPLLRYRSWAPIVTDAPQWRHLYVFLGRLHCLAAHVAVPHVFAVSGTFPPCLVGELLLHCWGPVGRDGHYWRVAETELSWEYLGGVERWKRRACLG
jgi:hypothetical protein